jgi:WD40 repeat protein
MTRIAALAGALVMVVGLARAPAQGPKEVTATSPDRKLLARAKGPTVEVRELASRRLISSIRAHRTDVTSLNISPDSKRLVSADGAGMVCMMDLANGRLLWQYRGAVGVQIITFSNDGTKLSATLKDRSNLQLEAATGRRLPPAKP